MDTVLRKELQQVNTRPENRKNLLERLHKDTIFFTEILQLVITDQKMAPHASRAIELVGIQDISLLVPHIHTIFKISKTAHHHSVIRAMAKLMECLVLAHFSSKSPVKLTDEQLSDMTSICFDWLIGKYKIAAQVYSMECLFQLGKIYDWIYSELLQVLLQHYPTSSKGYQSRAGKIIRAIEKRSL